MIRRAITHTQKEAVKCLTVIPERLAAGIDTRKASIVHYTIKMEDKFFKEDL
jgi:hypothetical protein